MDRGAWWATGHGGRKESDMTEELTHQDRESCKAAQEYYRRKLEEQECWHCLCLGGSDELSPLMV